MKMYRSNVGACVLHAGNVVVICSADLSSCDSAFLGDPATGTLDILHDPSHYTEVSLPADADALLLTLLQEFCKRVADSDR